MSLEKLSTKKDFSEKIDKLPIPNHVAVIMDGNGRWAANKSLPRSIGHKKGAENVEEILIGSTLNLHPVEYLFCFANCFSFFLRI